MMKKQRFFRLAWCLAIIAVLSFGVSAQEEKASPELSVNGVKLGNRESAGAFLQKFLPTTDENGFPAYYFYNDMGKQVLKLTAASFDDQFLITGIEVFTVGESYRKSHFYLEKVSHFVTESKIFVGYKASVAAMIIGIPNVSRDSRIGPKDLVKKKGEPTTRTTETDREILTYNLPNIEITDEKGGKNQYDYSARFEFRDKKLKRFLLKISPLKKD